MYQETKSNASFAILLVNNNLRKKLNNYTVTFRNADGLTDPLISTSIIPAVLETPRREHEAGDTPHAALLWVKWFLFPTWHCHHQPICFPSSPQWELFWPAKMLPKSSVLKIGVYCTSCLFLQVSNMFTYFKHDDRNCEQGLGQHLQVQPLISIIIAAPLNS